MKIWAKLLTLLVVLGLAGVAQAKEKKDKGGVRGKITAVSADSITIDSTTKKAAGESHTYKIANATVSINGELKTVADLKVGQLASVKASGDSASSITATSGKGGKKKKAA